MPANLDIPLAAPNVTANMLHTHVRMSITPNDDESLAYDLAIPKGWAYSQQFGPVATGLLETQGIGFFAAGVHPDGPVIAATVTTVPYEIPLDTWARMSLTHEGWEVVDAKWFPGPYGLFFDLTGQRTVGESQQVRRTSVRVRGSQIFSLHCMCSRTQWEEHKEIFWVAHLSFELGLKGSTRMEPWLAGVGAKPDFQFGFPASWSAEPKTPEPEVTSLVDVRLLDAADERLLAYLQVTARRRAQGEAAPNLLLYQSESQSLLTAAGFVANDKPRKLTTDEDPRAEAVQGWLGGFIWEGVMKGGAVYVRTGFLDQAGATFVFTLISPRLQDDPLIALRAQRAFEIARSTLVTPEANTGRVTHNPQR